MARVWSSILLKPGRLFLACIAIIFFTIKWYSYANQHNPVSHFFDPTPETFAPRYSDKREREARTFILEAQNKIEAGETFAKSQTPVKFAVVFITVNRKRTQYLDAGLGSFLEGLSPADRRKIWLNVVVGDDSPDDHAFFYKPWLHGLVDEVTVRVKPKEDPKTHLHSAMDKSKIASLHITPAPYVDPALSPLRTSLWHRKATLDYIMALHACMRAQTQHCLVIEDDTVLTRGWYQQVISYLDEAEDKWVRDPSIHSRRHDRVSPWGYIRLFYAEKYFGWENTEVPQIALASIVFTFSITFVLFALARFWPVKGQGKASNLYREKDKDKASLYSRSEAQTNRVATVGMRLPLASILILALFSLTQFILFILSGRNHVYSVPDGLSAMPERGCCTQGNIYPSDILPELTSHLLTRSGEKPYDILINRWMESKHFEKLAINPPVLQHIGLSSSRELMENYQRSSPLWSFTFEERQPLKAT